MSFDQSLSPWRKAYLNLKTRQKLLWGFSIPLFLMLVIIAIVYVSFRGAIETSAWVSHTHQVIAKVQKLSKLMVDMETGERGFLITGQKSFLEPFIDAKKEWKKEVKLLRALVSDNEKQIQRLDKINRLQNDWHTQAAEPEINARERVGNNKESMKTVINLIRSETGKNIVDSIRNEIHTFATIEEALLSLRSNENKQASKRTFYIIFIGTAFAIIIALLTSLTLANMIVSRLKLLVNATTKMSKDELIDLDKILIEGDDEIAELGTSFNEMNIKLMTSHIKRLEANEETSRSQKRVQAVFDHSVVSLITIDNKGIIDSFNHAAEDLLGYKSQEVIGKNVKILMPETIADIHDNYLNVIGSNQKPKIIGLDREVEARHKDGKTIPVQILVGKMSLDGKDYFIGSLQDLTEQKIAENKIKHQNENLIIEKEKAEIATQAKDDFLATMSHEIRTPMNGVLGMTQLLLDSNLNIEQQEYVKTINHSGKALLEIINDILDFTKIEAGHMRLDPQPFSLQNTAEQVHSMLKPRADEKNVDFIINIDKSIPDTLLGDDIRIRQILINLAGNAIKFTKEGNVKISLQLINEKNKNAKLHFSVTDTGIGIKQDKLKSLFNAFEQADSGTTRQFGGTGLGLTISLKFVQMMGGKINVESVFGKGSDFSFDIELPVTNQEILQTQPSDQTKNISLDILLAEDNLVNQLVAKAMLEQLGCHVHIANNGIEALQALEKKVFDLVLMDCHMPELDGYDTTRNIRENPKLKVTIVIALTANAMKEDKKKCMDVGMDDFLTKPLDKTKLVECLSLWKKQIEQRSKAS